jgi:ribosomal protein S18 acetylase RimI-like enzyme
MPRTATLAGADVATAARLLWDFNEEYGDPAPPLEALTARLRALMKSGETAVALADDDLGVAVLRFRPNLWSAALECYLAELYVVPPRRGQGLGRALLTHVLELARERGADRIELGTSEDDVAARKLYTKLGFTRHEGTRPEDPLMFVYERDL